VPFLSLSGTLGLCAICDTDDDQANEHCWCHFMHTLGTGAIGRIFPWARPSGSRVFASAAAPSRTKARAEESMVSGAGALRCAASSLVALRAARSSTYHRLIGARRRTPCGVVQSSLHVRHRRRRDKDALQTTAVLLASSAGDRVRPCFANPTTKPANDKKKRMVQSTFNHPC
jgi:hypothetical protein